MIQVELKGLSEEFPSKMNMNEPDSWIEWRNLDLYDHSKQRSISEWFYVAACSPQYLEGATSLSAPEKRAIMVQDHFDEAALLEFSRKKFQSLSFDSWDDFYEKMTTEFIYED